MRRDVVIRGNIFLSPAETLFFVSIFVFLVKRVF